MRPPKGIKPSPMDMGYEKVKNLDPKHQILVIYKALRPVKVAKVTYGETEESVRI